MLAVPSTETTFANAPRGIVSNVIGDFLQKLKINFNIADILAANTRPLQL
jgi:hypothetical protein